VQAIGFAGLSVNAAKPGFDHGPGGARFLVIARVAEQHVASAVGRRASAPAACAIGQGSQPEPGATAEYRYIKHGCDTSNGDSGAPLYAFGWGLPFLIGHHEGTSSGSTTTPNQFRPVTTGLLWTMGYYADACARSPSCI
jgi:hypothetical protein